MPRNILSEDQLHPSIRTLVANHEQAIVREVMAAASNHRVLVVGMGSNPYCKKHAKRYKPPALSTTIWSTAITSACGASAVRSNSGAVGPLFQWFSSRAFWSVAPTISWA